jgi:hypothetical protein
MPLVDSSFQEKNSRQFIEEIGFKKGKGDLFCTKQINKYNVLT